MLKVIKSVFQKRITITLILIFLICFVHTAQQPRFRVIAFYTAKSDQAHISFVHEANRWFSSISVEKGFVYDSTPNWNNLNPDFLSKYQVVIFLDTRPDSPDQRAAFEQYMKKGGAWMGFHFAGFSLTPSDFPQNWDWYHNHFLGCGEYKGNTWPPVPAILRIETPEHPVGKGLPATFKSAPNEWYSWQLDVRKNPDIRVLLSVDSTSFPLGIGPKLHEIWQKGDYPVVWTNSKYRMIYINMGHNAIDYEHNTNKELSYTFKNAIQNQLILNALFWLAD